MATIPTSRPAIPLSRPGAPSTPGAAFAAAPVVDPVKLVKKYKWLLMAAAAAGVFLGTVTHYALLYTYPIYTAQIFYKVFPLEDNRGHGNPAMGSEEELKRFIATEVHVLNSDRIIDKAVNDPRLIREAPKWSGQFMVGAALDTTLAAKALKKNLSSGALGESNFIRMSFWWRDKVEATAVARVVGQAYARDRQLTATGDLTDRRSSLTRSIEDMGVQIQNKQKDRQRILQEQKVESLDEHLNEANTAIRNIQDRLVDVRIQREAMVVQRNRLQAERDAPTLTYPDAMRKRVDDEQGIQRIKASINELEAHLTALRKSLSEDHRTIQRRRRELEGQQQQLDAERQRMLGQAFDAELETYNSQVSMLDAQEDDLLKKLEIHKARAGELTQILQQVKDLSTEIDRLTATKSGLQEDLQRLDLGTRQNRVYLYQDAQIPPSPTFPRLTILIPLGAILAVGLVVGVVVLIEIVDQRVKTPADIAALGRTRVLGIVPHAGEDPGAPQRVETVFRDLPSGILAESYRQVRAAVLKRMQQAGHKTLLVMSGMPGSGATSVVCNLAFSVALAEEKVLVIDANFRRPALHRIFEAREGKGLSDVLTGAATLAEAVQTTATEGLHVLTAGSADNRLFERLSNSKMTDLLREAAGRYDLVLIDVAPAMVAGDAVGLANRCDATMLVVRAMGEKKGLVARLRNEIAETRTDFLGVLVNAVRSATGGYLRGNIRASHSYQNGKE